MIKQNRALNLSPFFLCLAGFISGVLAVFSFAPYNISLIIFISFVTLLCLLYNQDKNLSFKIGFFWGLGFFGVGIRWIYISINLYGSMSTISNLLLIALLIIYLALFPAFFAWLLNFPSKLKDDIRYCLWAPAIWLLIEWLRSSLFTGFPWLELGYSQLNAPFSNIAPIFSVDGITFLIVLTSGFLMLHIQNNQILYLIPIALIICSTVMLKYINWVTPSEKSPVKVAIIQENIMPNDKHNPKNLIPMIKNYQKESSKYWNADLIIWPETAIPVKEQEVLPQLSLLHTDALEHKTSILTGIINYKNYKQYNSIITLGMGQPEYYQLGENQVYNKYHLLPFGEFIPFENIFNYLNPFINLPNSNFSQGAPIQANLKANGYNIAPAICFEILFNEEVRRNITTNTDILLTVSNDSWFGDSDGPRQHLQIAQMRALEFGKPLIRATNSGISALVNHKGEIIQKLDLLEKGSFVNKLLLTKGTTPYYRWGKKPLYLIIFLFIFMTLFSKRRNKYDASEYELYSWQADRK